MFNLERVISKVNDKVGLVHASLLDSTEITPEIHRVVISFNTEESSKAQKYQAIAKLFDYNASPIENSFREIASAHKYTLSGFVAVNNQAIPYTEELASSGKYTAIAGTNNVLIDQDDESLWEVTSSGDNKFLVRKSQENLSELVALASLRNENPNYRKIAVEKTIAKTFTNDYVAYVNPETCLVNYGYVLADANDFYGDEEPEVEVLDADSMETVKVNPELIVESAFLNGDDEDNLPSTETAASYDTNNKESMKAYYKEMFKHAPEYYKKIEQIINEHSPV